MARDLLGDNTVLKSLNSFDPPFGTTPKVDLSYLPGDTGGSPLRHVLPRDGDRALRFTGTLVGSSVPTPGSVGTVVSIWRTQGGNYITYVHQWQQRDTGLVERRKGGAHNTGDAAVQWFKDNNRGVLGSVTLEAWEQACKNDPELAGLQYEDID